MSSNLYYGVKEADYNFSFFQAQWLTSYELLNKLKISNLNNYNMHHLDLVYPNELILNDTQQIIIDVLLLAKYTDKCGNLKLKSILLSQLISSIQASAQTTGSAHFNSDNSKLYSNSNQILILSLPKESYYWCDVDDTHMIPKFALRVGYDQFIKQFSYIGRMKIASLFDTSSNNQNENSINSLPQLAINLTHKINNLIGTLTHIYEYIPAIVLKLHDLSYLDDKKFYQYQHQYQQQQHEYFNHNLNNSMWSKLKAAIKSNNSSDIDFSLISTNYEVLCLKRQPATLKQLCKMKLIEIEEETFDSINFNFDLNQGVNKKNMEINKSLRSLPNSIRNLLWPSYLEPGTCISKSGKMRSSNGIYELSINKDGAFRFVKLIKTDNIMLSNDTNDYDYYLKQVTTFEKNVESLLVSKSGVYLIYDNKQATRKPTLFYKHLENTQQSSTSSQMIALQSSFVNEDSTINYFNNLFDNSLESSYLFELSDTGFLRVIIQQQNKSNDIITPSKPIVINILNLNEYFSAIETSSNNILYQSSSLTTTTTKTYLSNQSIKATASIEASSSLSSVDKQQLTNNRSVNINLTLIANINELKNIPIRLINLFLNVIKSLFQTIIYKFARNNSSLIDPHLN